jgi:hypothetical protein
MFSRSFFIIAHVCLFLFILSATSSVWASPVSSESGNRLAVVARQTAAQPYFPDTPASCPICAQGYPSISSCAEAAPVLANLTTVCGSVPTLRVSPAPKHCHVAPLEGHFQPRGVPQRDQVRLHGHFPVHFPAMCRLVRESTISLSPSSQSIIPLV